MPTPEINHFLDRGDADGVDELDVPVPGASFPFRQFARDEDVEGQFAGHEAFLARVFGDLAQEVGGAGGVVGGGGEGVRFQAAVEFEVGGASDVVV